MKINRVNHDDSNTSTTINNAIFNSGLSMPALGLLVTLLRTDTTFSNQKEVMQATNAKRIAFTNARKELEQAGYLIINHTRKGGQFYNEWIVNESLNK